MPRNGTTVLLGAGFSQSMDLPSTDELTRLVSNLKEPALNLGASDALKEVPIAGMLWRMMSSYYSKPNFETMLHGIESMLSVQTGVVGVELPDAFKPAVNAFMDVTPRWMPLVHNDLLINLATRIISTVADTLVQRRMPLDLTAGVFVSNRDAIAAFKLGGPLTIANLNYDDTAYLMFPQAVDGFGKASDDGAIFAYRNLTNSDEVDHLLHLHGSVLYRLMESSSASVDEESSKPRPRHIVKFPRPEMAKGSWEAIDDIGSQSGERVLVGPIITGLRKAEKTLYGPYGYYLHEFVRALLESPRLVLAGYGGSDTYVNHWLEQWRLYHGANARLAMITRTDFGADAGIPAMLTLAGQVTGIDPQDLVKRLPTGAMLQEQNGLIFNGGFPVDAAAVRAVQHLFS